MEANLETEASVADVPKDDRRNDERNHDSGIPGAGSVQCLLPILLGNGGRWLRREPRHLRALREAGRRSLQAHHDPAREGWRPEMRWSLSVQQERGLRVLLRREEPRDLCMTKAEELLWQIAAQIKAAEYRNEVYVMPLETQKKVVNLAVEVKSQ